MRRSIDIDVDPVRVAERAAARAAYMIETAGWGRPMRCKTNICDGDGSCVACGADQGERRAQCEALQADHNILCQTVSDSLADCLVSGAARGADRVGQAMPGKVDDPTGDG
jgi:hypothetical protein